ncbi:hypothetical protein MSPP1_002427 [Malassezia sp. CBS 17886]|nr:hypothetical protein MSPP1_002427 [Malassezia sp. CBS 17886]
MSLSASAHAYLYASIFDEYHFAPPADWRELARNEGREAEAGDAADEEDEEDAALPYISFEVNLTTVVTCLALFESQLQSSNTPSARARISALDIVYERVGEPLCLRVQSPRFCTSFRLRTLDASLLPALQFDGSRAVAQVIMQSEWLSRAFHEVTSSGDARVSIALQAASPGDACVFKLSTDGSYGSTEIDFRHDSVLTEKFDCAADVAFAYPLASIQHMLQAARSSLKTSLRTDERGMLSMQFMIASHRVQADAARGRSALPSVAASGHAFVEFLCSPLE